MLDSSCKKDPVPEVLAGFSYLVDGTDFKTVHFTNASQNYSKVEWDFGDGSAVTTTEDPDHTYTALGSFEVVLTATSTDGKTTDKQTQTVVIADPDAELTKLVGDVSKTWILLREVAAGVAAYPLEVGPIDKSTIWWAQGLNNDELANRPCILNDEFTFSRDGAYVYDTKGDFWAEGGVFADAVDNLCQPDDAANMIGINGEDLTAFGSGNHTFTLVTGANPTLTVEGTGAFIGLCKIGTNEEVKLPQESVTLSLIKLVEGAIADTLVVESDYNNDADPEDDAYWKITLVSYHNSADIPPLPGPKPTASFTASTAGLTVTFTNTSVNGTTYSWDFGDGGTSTEQNPVHTYASGGADPVNLTDINPNGEGTAYLELFLNDAPLTDADLQGGGWKVRVAENSIFVGPGLGNGSWWKTPLAFLEGTSPNPEEDWSCMTNDEFIFSAGGVFEYKTNGDLRNDGYMGSPNGCITDTELAAIGGNAVAFGSSVNSYTFTPASGPDRPIITLTNGTGAAFLGFYKGYYGGENTNGANPPNGGFTDNKYEVMGYAKSATKETLFVSVDITGDHSGTAAWSVILER